MFERKVPLKSCQIKLLFFQDADTGDTFKAEEYKLIKKAIKEGHYIEAHFSGMNDNKHFVTSRIMWLNQRRFNTQYKTYRY